MIKKKDFIFLLNRDLEMCDKTKRDMIRYGNIREGWGSTSGRKDCKVETNLMWFEHAERRLVDYVVRRVNQKEGSQITRGRGRPRKTIK